MNGNTLIVPITDFVRKARYYADLLPKIDGMIITREGRPYMDVKLNNRQRNLALLKFLDTIDPNLFADDSVWKAVAVRRNRKKLVKL